MLAAYIAARAARLRPTDLAVYLAIAFHAPSGSARVAHSELRAVTRLSKRGVQAALNRLVERRMLAYRPGLGLELSEFRLLPPPPAVANLLGTNGG